MVVLDTNIIIDHLRRPAGQATYLINIAKRHNKEDLALSVISIQELYEGRSTREARKEEALLATIAPLTILPYTYEVAEQAGEIAHDHRETMAFADAAIAATSLLNHAPLYTLNQKHFTLIKGLTLSEL